MAWASGISSSVAKFLSSRDNPIEWDTVLANASDLKRYQLYGSRNGEAKRNQSMDEFALIEGNY